MSKTKFSNGAYRGTTKSQDRVSQNMFILLRGEERIKYMSMQFNQRTGNALCMYRLADGSGAFGSNWYSMLVNRRGTIIKSSNTCEVL